MAGLEEKLGAPLPADLETEDARAELDRLVRCSASAAALPRMLACSPCLCRQEWWNS